MSVTQDSQRPQSQQVYLPYRGKVRHTYSGEGVVQVVNGPGNDNNVVNVKPKGQHSCCQAHTYDTVMAVKLLQYSGVEQYFNMVFVFFFFFYSFYRYKRFTFEHGSQLPHTQSSDGGVLTQRTFQQEQWNPSKYQSQKVWDQEGS